MAVIVLLADHNMEGQARMLLDMLQKLGWSDLLDLRLATFTEVGLTDDSSDRVVWRRAQELGMILLTESSPPQAAGVQPARLGGLSLPALALVWWDIAKLEPIRQNR